LPELQTSPRAFKYIIIDDLLQIATLKAALNLSFKILPELKYSLTDIVYILFYKFGILIIRALLLIVIAASLIAIEGAL
jgi:hypothetical protein